MFKLIKLATKPYIKELILSIIFVSTEALLEIFCPYLMSMLLDKGITLTSEGTYIMNVKEVTIISILMILCGVSAFILGVSFARMVAKYTKHLGYEIRKIEYKKLEEYSFHNLDSISSSSLLTRLTNDVTIISDTLSTSFRPLLRTPVLFIATLSIAISVSPKLSIVFIIALPVLAFLLFTIVMLVKPRFLHIQKIVDKMNKTTKESIISIKTIKAYTKENYEIEKFKKINDESRKVANKAMGLNALIMPSQELVLFATNVGLLFLGGYLAQDASYANIVVNMSLFLTYVTQMLATVQMASQVLLQFNRAEASVTRINEFLSVESEIKENKDSTLKIESGEIEFKDVSFSYFNDNNYVLNNINFKIESGEFIGIIGQTGSSKSTLINLIMRFYDTSKGEIFINNKNIKDYSFNELRKNIAISFQSPFLFNDTILNNIKWGNKDATMDEVIEASKIACCYDFITNDLKDGFNTIVSTGGTNLSGGQRQRVCLARAILMKPKILILDDSFSALDRVTESKVKESLKNSLKDTTKIVISQKISTIKESDKIIVLNKGHITNIGNHETLKKIDEVYIDIDSIQNEGLE